MLLLGGCGIRMAYSQLDWLVPWYLGDYVSLDRAQKKLLDVRLAARLDWHCSTQLTAYSGLLRELESDLRGDVPVDAQRLDLRLRQGEALWQVLVREITPDAGMLLAALSDEQVRELDQAFARRNTETREEFLDGSPEALRSRQIERMEKRLRDWFGPLSPAQRARVAAWSEALMPTTADWLQHRQRWQAAFVDALAQRSRPDFESRIGLLMRSPELMWSPAYRNGVAHNRMQTLQLLADVVNTADPSQRTHLIGEIAAWAEQFEQLACGPWGEPARQARS